MKINRSSPRHWCYLAAFGVNVVCAMLLRPFLHRRRSGLVLLYGHKLSGNLLAIHVRALQHPRPGMKLAFLTMDRRYHRELRRQGVACVLATSPSAIRWLATADAVVSDHGLHAMQAMLGRTDLRFFDVWHGIPFKGFDADDFCVQRRYDETWVASPLLASMYVEKFGFLPARVEITGYARTDRLIQCRDKDPGEFARAMGLPADTGRLVLFAPTWKQDDSSRNLFPFGLNSDEFCGRLSEVSERHGATIVLRTHLNSNLDAATVGKWPRLVVLPAAAYPDTEQVLLASDILVCDWSSIAFDFLLLDRPALFLDVAAPFKKGYSLGPEYRYGRVVQSFEALLLGLDDILAGPEHYWAECGASHARIRSRIYAHMADGRAAERCLSRLQNSLVSP